jgi:spermidine synthase
MKPFHLLAETLTPDGKKLCLYEHDGQMHLKVNGRSLMSTNATASEITLAELACHEITQDEKAHVLIGGLGFGYTLKRTLDLVGPGAKVHVAELLPEVVAWNREFLRSVNGELLDDGRVNVSVDDVCNVINTAPDATYDAIMLDVDNGPIAMVTESNARLYYQGGFDRLIRVLKPGGRVVFWSATKDRPFEKRLLKAGFKLEVVGVKAYEKAKRCTHTIFVADRSGERKRS